MDASEKAKAITGISLKTERNIWIPKDLPEIRRLQISKGLLEDISFSQRI